MTNVFFGNLVIIWWLVEACTQNLVYPIQKNCIFLKIKKKKDFVRVLNPQNVFCILVKFHTKIKFDCHFINITKLEKKHIRRKKKNYILYIRWMMFDDELFDELESQGLCFWKKSTLHIVKRK